MDLAGRGAGFLGACHFRLALGGGRRRLSIQRRAICSGGIIGLAAIVFAAVFVVRAAGTFESANTVAPNDADVPRAGAAGGQRVDRGSRQRAGGRGRPPVQSARPGRRCWRWSSGFSPGRADDKFYRAAFGILGWTLLAWAALRLPNGAPAFFAVVGAFLLLQIVIPSLKQLWRLPARPKLDLPPPTVVALLVRLCVLSGTMTSRGAGLNSASAQTSTLRTAAARGNPAIRQLTNPRRRRCRNPSRSKSASKTTSRSPRQKFTGRRKRDRHCRCCSIRRC